MSDSDMPMFDLRGRIALVTGAGQNVGAGIARALAHQGATVVVNDLFPERAQQTVDSLEKAGLRGVAAPFDVTQAAEVRLAIDKATSVTGPIDILVNNAGVPTGMATRKFREMAADEWAPYVDLNLYGSLNCISAVLDGMCDRGWGRIVQISSGAGRVGLALGISLYGAAKGGIEAFVRHLSQEVARTGVTANCVALGLMNTVPADAEAATARRVPIGRLGTPEDVGAAVVYVASTEAEWLTGQTIPLNGGIITG
jgi:NAD(P)-dependent dehydrogenase (short-subunit alcohol dehydrogenase family)